MTKRSLSVIDPVYNEAVGIKSFLERQLFPVLVRLQYRVEVLVIDDGSTDGSLKKINEVKTPRGVTLRIVAFTKNFGKEVALTAGLKYAKADAVIMLDADGQHPVSAIPKMIKKCEKGAMIVTAVNNGNSTRHKVASKMFYLVMRAMGNQSIHEGAMDFRLLDRVVVDEYNDFSEHNRIARGLIDWLGFPQEYIKVSTLKRTSGKPTYSRKKLARLALDSFVSMSSAPLTLFGRLGIFITVTSFIFGLFILVQQYILGDPLGLDWSGAVAMSVFVSFLVGLVLVSQAITALYISRIHAETKNRPLYVIDRKKSKNLRERKNVKS